MCCKLHFLLLNLSPFSEARLASVSSTDAGTKQTGLLLVTTLSM